MTRFAHAVALTAVIVVAGCTATSAPTTTTPSEPPTSTTTDLVSTTTSAPGSTTTTGAPSTTTTSTTTVGNDADLGRKALLSLASSSGEEVSIAGLGFTSTVSLGVHNVLSAERSTEELERASGWSIPVSEYAGFSGPFSPLETLRNGGQLVIEEGGHPHCAGPALDPPDGLEDATRVHAQPKNVDSCIAWFSVDLWIVDGSITAVTLELFGP